MLSKQLDILTPLAQLHRISRQIADVASFAVEPGMWVKLDANGRVENIPTAAVDALAATDVVELCLSNAVTGELANYEGNDTKVGSATTIAEPGTRISVGAGLIEGTVAIGSKVAVNQAADATDGGVSGGGFIVATTGMIVGTVTGVGSMTEIRLSEPTFV